jgi:pyruvate,orthophosphate dikinase
MTKYVYRFGGDANDGGKGDKNLLGGKGANLDGMASIGLPVPPGFTITTEMCTRYYADGEVFPDSLRDEVKAGIAHIEGVTASASAMRRTRCWSRCAPARGFRCRA